MKQILISMLTIIVLAACTQSAEPAPPTPPAVEASAEDAPETADTSSSTAAEAIAVTYFTPAQQEGPYYPVNKLQDRDNDLVELAGAAGTPAGQVVEFTGRVYDAQGMPLEGITIEIWQTDESGVYLHPNDPGTAGRDPNFQFYGEAVTDAGGNYRFRTILPGRYEPRPRHIHVKIKLDGRELLTTQFYFADEITLPGDEAALLIDLEAGQDAAGNPVWVGQRDIVLNWNND